SSSPTPRAKSSRTRIRSRKNSRRGIPMGLQQIVAKYHSQANKIARRRADKNGQLPALRYEGKLNKVVGHTRKDGKSVSVTLADVIQNYRTSADRVRALILPEDEVPAETQWQLESTSIAATLNPKFSGKDKVANPKELIEKANK